MRAADYCPHYREDALAVAQGAMGRPFGYPLIHSCASQRDSVAAIVEHRTPYPKACGECWGQPVALIGLTEHPHIKIGIPCQKGICLL